MLVTVILVSLATAAAFWWLCVRSDYVAFLPARSGADWILFPKPPEAASRYAFPITDTFRRTITLNAPAASALLKVSAFKTAAVTINGHPAVSTPGTGRDWKFPSMVQIARLLHPGTNEVTVWVTNTFGPPALWLRLDIDETSVGTDERWEVWHRGAAPQKARRASQPPPILPGSLLCGGERIVDSLGRTWPAVALYAVAALLLVLVAGRWLQPCTGHLVTPTTASSSRWIYGLLALVLIARTALFINDGLQLPREVGFDAKQHEEYIQFITQKDALPMPGHGWQMHQPPLYYAGSALLLKAFGLSVADENSAMLLRAVNGIVGLAHCWLALLCLRCLFPHSPAAQAVGLLVAAFLPTHLYLSQYVTNEPLAGFFVTLALWLCLRALRQESNSFRLDLGLGAALGAASLTKLSALLILPCFLASLCMKPLLRQERARPRWLLGPSLALVSCLVVCGWHYVRVWTDLGNLPLPNWETDPGSVWWQDPGFRTSSFFSSFGQALVAPCFAGHRSLADGIYTTLWGDGLLSGAGSLAERPPWNYDLMGAAYVLALGLSALAVLGFVVALIRFIRQAELEWFLMLGIVSMLGLGIVYFSLSRPWMGHVKAYYAFPALVPLSALVALGWETLQAKHPAFRHSLWVLLLVWTMTVYSAFWVRRGNPETHQLRGIYLAKNQRDAEAVVGLTRALESKPNLAAAHNALGETLLRQGKLNEARVHFVAAIEARPDDALGHYNLGDALLREQRTAEAIGEFRSALRLRPDWPEVLNNLAWQLAVHPKAEVRNGAEAIPLAQRACELTGGRNFWLLSTLAAAYAEAGRFPEAVTTQQQVCDLAAAQGQTAQAESLQRRLELYRSGHAYHLP